jgi:hypothetical protein
MSMAVTAGTVMKLVVKKETGTLGASPKQTDVKKL